MQRRRWKVRDVVELALILGGLILIGSPFFLLGGHFATRPPPQQQRATTARPARKKYAPPKKQTLLRREPSWTPREPAYGTLCGVLDAWDPHVPDVPPGYVDALPRFDAARPEDQSAAAAYRDAELPFILYNVSALRRATARWTRAYLRDRLAKTSYKVEESVAGRSFVYYAKDERAPAGWTAPQVAVAMTPRELEEALDARNRSRLYYATISASEGRRQAWIRDDLPFLAPLDKARPDAVAGDDWWRDAEGGSDEPLSAHFFMRPGSTRRWKGINCRLGMRGVQQTAHYDGKRNWIAMIAGAKRYVLQPPRACAALELLGRGHPSERHASFDWADPAERRRRAGGPFCDAPAVEVLVRESDLLYLPSYWFHYIVSATRSVQCNARTGLSRKREGWADIERCGFGAPD